jgi:hypothetical protein
MKVLVPGLADAFANRQRCEAPLIAAQRHKNPFLATKSREVPTRFRGLSQITVSVKDLGKTLG